MIDETCIVIINSTEILDCPPCDRAFPLALGLIIGMWIGLMIFLIWYKFYIAEQNEIIDER